jgi:hypothetical protein
MDDLEQAWAELHGAIPPGWFVGRPPHNPRKTMPWEQYAFDTTERPRVGHRSREWTAVAPTQARVVREIEQCLREISEGGAPR